MSTTAPDHSIVATLGQKLGIEIDKVVYDEQGNLIKLTLSELSLARLPPEISQLRNLQELDLNKNQLKEVTAEIGQLEKLQELSLAHNQLRQLPLQLGQLGNLQKLDVSDNPDLLTPPPEIVTRGTQDIISFLQFRAGVCTGAVAIGHCTAACTLTSCSAMENAQCLDDTAWIAPTGVAVV